MIQFSTQIKLNKSSEDYGLRDNRKLYLTNNTQQSHHQDVIVCKIIISNIICCTNVFIFYRVLHFILLSFFLGDGNLYIIMDYCEGGIMKTKIIVNCLFIDFPII